MKKLLDGSRLRQVRLWRNMSQTDLAKECGFTNTFISHLENDRKDPSIRTLVKLSDTLGVNMEYLLGRGDEIPR